MKLLIPAPRRHSTFSPLFVSTYLAKRKNRATKDTDSIRAADALVADQSND